MSWRFHEHYVRETGSELTKTSRWGWSWKDWTQKLPNFIRCPNPFYLWPSPKDKIQLLSKHMRPLCCGTADFSHGDLSRVEGQVKPCPYWLLRNCLTQLVLGSAIVLMPNSFMFKSTKSLQRTAECLQTSFGWNFTYSFSFFFLKTITSSGLVP